MQHISGSVDVFSGCHCHHHRKRMFTKDPVPKLSGKGHLPFVLRVNITVLNKRNMQ